MNTMADSAEMQPQQQAQQLVVAWTSDNYFPHLHPDVFEPIAQQVRRCVQFIYPLLQAAVSAGNLPASFGASGWFLKAAQANGFSLQIFAMVLTGLERLSPALAGPHVERAWHKVVHDAAGFLAAQTDPPQQAHSGGPSLELPHNLHAELMNLLTAGDFVAVTKRLKDLLDAGLTPQRLFDDVIRLLQYEAGARWHQGTLAIHHEQVINTFLRQFVQQLPSESVPVDPQAPALRLFSLHGELHSFGLESLAKSLRLDHYDAAYCGSVQQASDVWNALQGHPLSGASVLGEPTQGHPLTASPTEAAALRPHEEATRSEGTLWTPDPNNSWVVGFSLTMPQFLPKLAKIIHDLRPPTSRQQSDLKNIPMHPQPYQTGIRAVLVGGKALNDFPELFPKSGADAWASDAREVRLVLQSLLRLPHAKGQ